MKRTQGFSLLELAIALVILGMITVLLWHFLAARTQTVQAVKTRDLLATADESLTGFVAAKHRLPCPDTNTDGGEDCTGTTQVGTLPYLTLGLPDAQAGRIRYGVLRRAAAAPNGAIDLSWSPMLDVYYPLLATGSPPIAARLPLGASNTLDLCYLTRSAADMPYDSNSLHVVTGATNTNIAYALALPGPLDADNNGNVFDGNQTVNNAFDSSQRPNSAAYDDRVRVVGLDQLWARLHCAESMSAIGHAHFNVASSAVVLLKGMHDYDDQLRLSARVQEAAYLAAVAATFSAAAGVTKAATSTLIAVSMALASQGALSGLTGPATAAVVANAIAVVSAGISVGLAEAARDTANQRVTEFATHLTTATTVTNSIVANARAADAAGF